jgi:hypothetical protein
MTDDATPTAAHPDTVVAPKPSDAICSNCGTPLLGEHCYHCGQPVKGLVRRFSSVLGDIADTLFEIDTRLTRTVAPLLLRPGYLSTEYFAGRRVRYVSPVRLFFFVSVIAFFVAQWTFDAGNTQAIHVQNDGINSATTVADVQTQRDAALKNIELGRKAAGASREAQENLSNAEGYVRKKADKRIAEINAALAKGKPPPEHIDKLTFGDDDKPWDPVTNPIQVKSLPAFANGWLNNLAGRAQGNFARIQQNPNLLFDAWLSAVPSTLFLLMPLFAVLLKIAYLLKRRLYMEHFIVALHSHAFLCFALLLALVLHGLAGVATNSWMRTPLEIGQILLYVWMPLYLWLMQKRVYGQGWIMTTLKYSAIGTVYLVLLSFGAAMSLVVKLIWL